MIKKFWSQKYFSDVRVNSCHAELFQLYFSLKLELLMQFPAANDEKIFIFFENLHLLI